jgi:hypothetical protein
MIRHLRALSPFSLVANIIYIIAFVITLEYLFTSHEPSSRLPFIASINSMPLFFGTVMFAFEGVVLVGLLSHNSQMNCHFFDCRFYQLKTAALIHYTLYLQRVFSTLDVHWCYVFMQQLVILVILNSEMILPTVSLWIYQTHGTKFILPISIHFIITLGYIKQCVLCSL